MLAVRIRVCGASIRVIVPVISGLVLVAVCVVQEGILCRPSHICHTGFCRPGNPICAYKKFSNNVGRIKAKNSDFSYSTVLTTCQIYDSKICVRHATLEV